MLWPLFRLDNGTMATAPPPRSLLQRIIRFLAKKWNQWRWRLASYHTPLKLRYSVGVLRQCYSNPTWRLLLLLFRFPRHLPCDLPPCPRQITAYEPETYMDERHPDIYELRMVPVWRWRDTMQSSFYRLYETICACDESLTGYETEYWWKRTEPGWNPELLRDPRDDGCVDEEQLSVLASVAEAIVDSFNWRLEQGLRRDGNHVERDDFRAPTPHTPYIYPVWTTSAPVLEKKLLLHDYGSSIDSESSPQFARRNIQASTAALHTV